jgi:glycerol kinase
MEKKYILAIDSGSTGIRAILFDKTGTIVGREYKTTPSENPEPGAIEQDPFMMWETLKEVTNKIFKIPNLTPESIAAIGITNQRGSFCLWEKDTGKPICNFINWADVRSVDTADSMNKNGKWKMLKSIASLVSKFGSAMMTTTSMLEFTTDHATVRLNWYLNNHPEIRERCKKGEILFGTLDTWYIYQMTGGKAHVTDYTNAASTGLLNPFDLAWNKIVCDLFKIPMAIFPTVVDTNGDFGVTDKSIFGAEIPIRAAVGDQQSALFGQGCFTSGDVKLSQGSGAFVDCNMGPKALLSKRGLLPLIAWKLESEETPYYMLEGLVATAGTLIDWLGSGIGLSDTPTALNEFAAQCDNTEGVIFIPTPMGIRYPYFNARVKASIMGLSLNTHRRHVARAVFEGLANRIIDIIEGIEADTKVKIKSLKVDGGVSKSDILLQIIADLSDITVERAPEADMTATGAAYLAGLGVGFWKDQAELRTMAQNYTRFTPNSTPEYRKDKRNKWKKALNAVLKVN